MVGASKSEAGGGPIRYGMVGGGQGAFIGAVHRIAARMDNDFVLVAGAAITASAYVSIHETHPPALRVKGGGGFVQSYVALLRRPRFNALVLQTGFNSASFMVMASASASLMIELLHRPAAEFGIYFLLFPFGFFAGNVISSRVGNRASTELMVLIGSVLTLAAIAGQGYAGAALSFVNYRAELPFFCERVLPLLREAGLRA